MLFVIYMNSLDKIFIYVLLVMLDLDSLNKSRLLDLHKIQWYKLFLKKINVGISRPTQRMWWLLLTATY